ncbi:MAG: phenylalanine--tRNA ligase subunit beta [Candidatus Jordarchaeaceae archaeon]
MEGIKIPVITLTCNRMSELLGRKIDSDELEKTVPWLGLDIEEKAQDYLKVEYNPNRPDFSSQEGIARALRGFMEIETGLPKYKVTESGVVVKVDPALAEIRPYIVCAVVRNVSLNDENIVELIGMQEDLHWAIGRDRVKSSIGIHDFDKVKPPFEYRAVDPEGIKFIPLNWAVELTPREILMKHPKGRDYAHIMEGKPKYPIITDTNNDVLSFPPIINGILTQLTEETRNLFIDVTGTTLKDVTSTLNILVTSLAEGGAKIESVKVEYSDKVITTPDLTPKTWSINPDYVNRLLGLELSVQEIIKSLEKVRMEAEYNSGKINVRVPAYRHDIMHEVDFVEEVAIGYGLYNLKPTFPKTLTIAEAHPYQKLSNLVKSVLVGLGLNEVISFTLTNFKEHYDYMRTKGKPVELLNPVSVEFNMVRDALLPGLIKILKINKHEALPQKIFEVGDVVFYDPEAETSARRQLNVAAAITDTEVGFTDIKAIAEALLRELGCKHWKFRPISHHSFIEGRVASIEADGKIIGHVGEIHPEVLNNFDLEYPVGAFECSLESFVEKIKKFGGG